jgi:hypothetical protein
VQPPDGGVELLVGVVAYCDDEVAVGQHVLEMCRPTLVQHQSPEQYNEKPQLLCGYYSYWSGLPMNRRFENYIRPERGWAAFPTNDDLTLVVAGWPFAEFAKNKNDIERNYLNTFNLAPEFADRIRSATREERVIGTAVPGYLRKPFGPGWALVGDAVYNKDFITAQGIADAFRDAELCAAALDETVSGSRPFDIAMADYQVNRDAHVLPMYEFTAQLASLTPPPPELQQLLGAIHGNQEAMDGFARVNSGVTSPAEFFSEENVGRISPAPSELNRIGIRYGQEVGFPGLLAVLGAANPWPLPCHLDQCADEDEPAAAKWSVSIQVRPVDIVRVVTQTVTRVMINLEHLGLISDRRVDVPADGIMLAPARPPVVSSPMGVLDWPERVRYAWSPRRAYHSIAAMP